MGSCYAPTTSPRHTLGIWPFRVPVSVEFDIWVRGVGNWKRIYSTSSFFPLDFGGLRSFSRTWFRLCGRMAHSKTASKWVFGDVIYTSLSTKHKQLFNCARKFVLSLFESWNVFWKRGGAVVLNWLVHCHFVKCQLFRSITFFTSDHFCRIRQIKLLQDAVFQLLFCLYNKWVVVPPHNPHSRLEYLYYIGD